MPSHLAMYGRYRDRPRGTAPRCYDFTAEGVGGKVQSIISCPACTFSGNPDELW